MNLTPTNMRAIVFTALCCAALWFLFDAIDHVLGRPVALVVSLATGIVSLAATRLKSN